MGTSWVTMGVGTMGGESRGRGDDGLGQQGKQQEEEEEGATGGDT